MSLLESCYKVIFVHKSISTFWIALYVFIIIIIIVIITMYNISKSQYSAYTAQELQKKVHNPHQIRLHYQEQDYLDHEILLQNAFLALFSFAPWIFY